MTPPSGGFPTLVFDMPAFLSGSLGKEACEKHGFVAMTLEKPLGPFEPRLRQMQPMNSFQAFVTQAPAQPKCADTSQEGCQCPG
jgi:hypothetical protein